MQQITLNNALFAQCYHVEFIVFAYCVIKIEFAFDRIFAHEHIVIFVSKFFIFNKAVSMIFFSVGANITRILSLNPSEIQNLFLFFFCLSICSNFSTWWLLGLICFWKDTWREVLGVKDPNFFLINKNEYNTLGQEKALVNAWAFTDVEAIEV